MRFRFSPYLARYVVSLKPEVTWLSGGVTFNRSFIPWPFLRYKKSATSDVSGYDF